MKILIVTPHLPYPGVAHGGGTLMLNNILYLRARNEILLASMYEADEQAQLVAIADYATLVVATPTVESTRVNAVASFMRDATVGRWLLIKMILRSFAGWILRSLFNYDHRPAPAPDTARFLREVLAKIDEVKPDLVQVEFTQLGAALEPGLRVRGVPAVVVAQDVEIKQLRRRWQREPWGLRKLLAYLRYRSRRRFEIQVCTKYQRVYTVSEYDQTILQQEAPSLKVSVRPHAMPIPLVGLPLPRIPGMVLFVGAMGRPENIEAVRFILNEVWAGVRNSFPAAELHLVGGGVTDEIRRHHNGKDIFVHGYVADLTPFYSQARVMVVPLFLGGGIIIKVFEALSHGLPTVATPIANEGVAAIPGQEILLASTAEEFIAAITRLFREDDLWQRLSHGGQQRMQTTYNPDRVAAELEQDYETIIQEFKSRA